jgi:hypothetical protein
MHAVRDIIKQKWRGKNTCLAVMIPLITAKPAKYPSAMVIATMTTIQNKGTSEV